MSYGEDTPFEIVLRKFEELVEANVRQQTAITVLENKLYDTERKLSDAVNVTPAPLTFASREAYYHVMDICWAHYNANSEQPVTLYKEFYLPGKKIQGIKYARDCANFCDMPSGLKECKEYVEWKFAQWDADPWACRVKEQTS